MSLFDTDRVVELLRRRRHEAGSISIITLIEVLRGLEAGKRPQVKRLLEESFNILIIDNKVIETYCSLYRKLREEGVPIPDADLLIAATAISSNATLITRDEHFEGLRNLGLKLAQEPA